MQTVDRLITQFRPDHYNLTLILSRQDRTFEGVVTLRGTMVKADMKLRLHAKDMTVTKALCDNNELPTIQARPELDEVVLEGPATISAGEHTLELHFSGTITDPMHGLYPCYYEHDGVKKELLATQLESHHARELFPCIDEPEAKATYDLTLYTEKNVTALGNMPVSTQTEEDDWLVTTFQTTPRMSSYLLAFVVGEMHCLEGTTNNGTDVRIWTTPVHPVSSLQFALDTAIRSIEFFNDYFQTPYPLPKSDHVAIPDFSSAAMENWGLITYREICLIVDESTSISSKELTAEVIAHELSHQWFGNLVTMKWWNDLWLNESFATFMAYLAVDHLYPEWDFWLSFATNEGLGALRRDALPGVQAVKVEVHHPDEIGTLFDPAIVYAKGARLLNMLHQYIGDDAFRAGLRHYFEQHSYGNTIGEDLWNALGTASDKAIASFMEPWLVQPGFPIVHVDQQGAQLALTQKRFSVGSVTDESDAVWPVPLLPDTPLQDADLLDTAQLAAQTTHNDIVRINTGGSGHYTVRYEQPQQRQHMMELVQNGAMGPTDRLLLLNDGAMQARAGIGSLAETLQLLTAYADESSEPVWDMMSLIIADTKRLIEGDEATELQLKKYVRTMIDTQYKRLGWIPQANEQTSDVKLRATIIGLGIYSEDADIINHAKQLYADGIATLSPELRSIILSCVVRFGDDTEFNDLLKQHDSLQNPELQQDVASGLTSTRNETNIAVLLQRLTDTQLTRPQDTARWFVWLLRNRYAREQTWQWMVTNWDWIEKTFGSDKSYDNYPRYAGAVLGTDEWLERYKSFFEPMMTQPALERTIRMGLTDIASRASWRARDADAIAQYLRGGSR